MQIETPAIVCAVLPHGEHGAIVRALSADHGLLAGYVRGGRGRRMRPVLGVGNIVAASFRARVEDQLAALTVELVRSRAGLTFEPLSAAALNWLGPLLATVLPEGQAHAQVHARFDALLGAMEHAQPLVWGADLARFELALLADLGFGIDLSACAATGQTHDLAWVSPRVRRAVGRAAGAPHAARLLALPAFLTGCAPAPDSAALADALRLTGHFVGTDLLHGPAARIVSARDRFAALVARRALA